MFQNRVCTHAASARQTAASESNPLCEDQDQQTDTTQCTGPQSVLMATWTVMDPNPHHRLNKRVTKLTTTSQKSGPSPQDTILLLWHRILYQSPATHCAKLF